MEKNKNIKRVKSAKKDIEKNKNFNKNIKNTKMYKNNNIFLKNNHSTNNKTMKQKEIIAKHINKNPKKIYSSNSNSITNVKIDSELDYDKLENLCNKRSTRNKKEIKNYMKKQKTKFKKDEEEKKRNFYKTYEKIFNNYKQLEKEIKNKNIADVLKEENKKIEKMDYNLNEKSNGSIENNKFKKNYYFGCMDVKRILSKKIIFINFKKNNNNNNNDNNNKKNNSNKKK